MLKALLRGLSFDGRIGRGSFIAWLAVLIVVGTVLVRGVDATMGAMAGTVIVAIALWAAICLTARRLHDTGRSAWWLLAFAVPVVGALWLAWITLVQKGAPGDNRFGPDPKQRAADYLTVA